MFRPHLISNNSPGHHQSFGQTGTLSNKSNNSKSINGINIKASSPEPIASSNHHYQQPPIINYRSTDALLLKIDKKQKVSH
jgi:hypothetical protein